MAMPVSSYTWGGNLHHACKTDGLSALFLVNKIRKRIFFLISQSFLDSDFGVFLGLRDIPEHVLGAFLVLPEIAVNVRPITQLGFFYDQIFGF